MEKSIFMGILATLVLLGAYFLILTLVSGWSFAQDQFSRFWYFVVSLAVGFGIQIGLYSYLKNSIHRGDSSGRVVAVTGTTSTVAMVSCCAHYLLNIVPVLGVIGFATIVSQYQVEFFWLGLLFNLAGIAFITGRIIKFNAT